MRPRFDIVFSEGVKDDLKKLRPHDRRVVMDAIEAHVMYVPNMVTKKRKVLRHLVPPFEAIPPIWQLRVGHFRIFYDVDEATYHVSIRAIRRKPAHSTTEEIL